MATSEHWPTFYKLNPNADATASEKVWYEVLTNKEYYESCTQIDFALRFQYTLIMNVLKK